LTTHKAGVVRMRDFASKKESTVHVRLGDVVTVTLNDDDQDEPMTGRVVRLGTQSFRLVDTAWAWSSEPVAEGEVLILWSQVFELRAGKPPTWRALEKLDPDELISATEAAVEFGIPSRHLYLAMVAGKFPSERVTGQYVGGPRLAATREDLAKFARAYRNQR
jgi:hypothetical protein